VQLNFALAIFFLGVGTMIGGLWQDKVGPRKVAATAVKPGATFGKFLRQRNFNNVFRKMTPKAGPIPPLHKA
jgi:hypothetical protein